jgi:hypothetical protein
MFKLRLLNVWYTRDHGQYKIVPKWEEEERENDFWQLNTDILPIIIILVPITHFQSRNGLPFRSIWVLPGFSGIRVARYLVSCVVFYRSLFVLFLFGHCIVCLSSIDGFWLPLWHLQTFLTFEFISISPW